MTKSKTKKTRDDYLDLIQQFPLRKISTRQENQAALDFIGRLLGRDGSLSDGESQYVAALASLISDYERRICPAPEKVTPVELLSHLMAENNMTITDLGKIVGSQPAASMILNGTRAISKAQAKRLGERFAINPGVFI